jgi:hypothetical protein
MKRRPRQINHTMKRNIATLLMALALTLPAVMTSAQDADPPRPPRGPRPPQREGGAPDGPGGPGQRPIPPLVAALDTNHDGVIDADEIANAPAALRKLDKNGDGKLTMDELRPPRPDGAPPGDGQPRPRRQPPAGE